MADLSKLRYLNGRSAESVTVDMDVAVVARARSQHDRYDCSDDDSDDEYPAQNSLDSR